MGNLYQQSLNKTIIVSIVAFNRYTHLTRKWNNLPNRNETHTNNEHLALWHCCYVHSAVLSLSVCVHLYLWFTFKIVV